MTIKNLPDIPVWSVSTIGVKTSGKAFALLESKLPSLKGRKFYGLLYGDHESGTYRACVVKDGQEVRNPESLEPWIIPGGKYASEKIEDWSNQIALIGKTFSRLAHEVDVDSSRPQIEFYQSQKEVIVMIPVFSSLPKQEGRG